MLAVAHETTGRIRLTHAAFRTDPGRAAAWITAVRRVAGVTDAKVNPVTGSLVVFHTGCSDVRRAALDALTVHEQPPVARKRLPAPSWSDPRDLVNIIAERLVDRTLRAIIAALT